MEEFRGHESQLEDLNKFIETSYGNVNEILSALEWDKDYLLKTDISSNFVTCIISNQHRVPSERISEHMIRCKWKNEGYDDYDGPLPEVTEHSKSSIVIDKQLQMAILRNMTEQCEDTTTLEVRNVPQTSARLMSEFTCAERLALYDYAVANTMPPAVLKAEELNISYKKDEGARAKTKLELLMEMRDAKRRRISYRSKKVHTNRKSHVEILREVIQNQMDFLQEINRNENEDEDEIKRCSETDDIKVENDLPESDTPKWEQDSDDTKHEKTVWGNSTKFLNEDRYNSQEWYTKDKYVPRKKYSERKDRNGSYRRRNSPLRYERYEQSSTSTDASQFLYDGHSDTRSETRREKSTNWYSQSKRERSGSSDWESGDNVRVRKKEPTYYETEYSKHHIKHDHVSRFRSSFPRSEKRTKERMKRMCDAMAATTSEYMETSKLDSEEHKHHTVKHKKYKLKATNRNLPRSDSESSEASNCKQTVPEHRTSTVRASEKRYAHYKEEYSLDQYYSF